MEANYDLNANNSMPDYSYEELQSPPPLNQQMLQTLDETIACFKINRWVQIHQCISLFRSINKFNPQMTNDILSRYNSGVLDILNNGNTQIMKNVLKWAMEIFKIGKNINVSKAVYLFVPILLKKAATEKGQIKDLSQAALIDFSNNCGYDISFTIVFEYCCDKSIQIAETSMKLLGALVQNVNSSIMQLDPNTLSLIMKCLFSLIDGKRNNMKKNALDVCVFICKSIGSDNYLSWMNYCLKPEQVNSMGALMESHRILKEKPLPLKTVIKERKTELLNHQLVFGSNENYDCVNNNNPNCNYNYNNYPY